jgi:hypothetical protein
VERENDYVLIISLDSVNSSAFVEAYTPIPPPLFLAFIYLHVTRQIQSHRLSTTPLIPMPTC